MITQRINPFEFNSIVPPRIAEAESRLSLDQLRARFARNDGLPFADVLTEPRIRAALDEHGVRYCDRVFNPDRALWGSLPQVRTHNHSRRAAGAGTLAHRAAGGPKPASPNPASSCTPRGRLPEGDLSPPAGRPAAELQAAAAEGK